MSLEVIRPWIDVAAILVGVLIAARLGPKDHHRAAHLSRLANDVAAGVVSMRPTATWAELLQSTVTQLTNSAATPTTNSEAIRRAAAAALLSIGKKPA